MSTIAILSFITIITTTACTTYPYHSYLNAAISSDPGISASLNICQDHHANEMTEMGFNNSSSTRPNDNDLLGSNLAGMEFKVTEFGTDENSLLLYPVYNNNSHTIWIGDTLPGSGRLFEFDIDTKNYTVHELEDVNLITFSVVDKSNPNIIWYIDPTQNIIGNYDVLSQKQDKYNSTIEGVISGLTMDESQNLWMSLIHANKIVKFNSNNKTFEGFDIPTKNSIPLNIIYDSFRNYIWFTESAVGKIGRLDLTTYEIKEYNYSGISSSTNVTTRFTNDNPIIGDKNKENRLTEPTVVFLNPIDCNIYTSDHKTNSVFSFNITSEEFKEYPLENMNGLAFGIAADNNGYLWVAEHIDDFLSVIDSETGKNKQVKIPSGSYVQYIISDRDGNIWFAEQGYDGLGTISTYSCYKTVK